MESATPDIFVYVFICYSSDPLQRLATGNPTLQNAVFGLNVVVAMRKSCLEHAGAGAQEISEEEGGGRKRNRSIWIASVVAAVAAVIIGVLFACMAVAVLRRRKERRAAKVQEKVQRCLLCCRYALYCGCVVCGLKNLSSVRNS